MIIGAITQTKCHKCGAVKPRYIDTEKFNAGKAKCRCGGMLGSPTYTNKARSTRWNPPIIDRTLGYYDDQLGAYVGSTSDRRRICKEKGLVMIKNDGTELETIRRQPEKTDAEKTQEYANIIKESAYNANMALPGVS